MATTSDVSRSDTPPLPWWLVLIQGIALVIVGLFLLAKPGMTSIIVIQFLGFYWLLVGILKLVSLIDDRELWGWKLFAGILGILAGIIVIRHPLWSTVVVGNTLIVLLGFTGIIMGAISIYQAFKGAGWGTGILGVVSVVLGFVLLLNAWVLTFSLPWSLGILSLAGGVIALVAAFRLKREESSVSGPAAAAATVTPAVAEPVREAAPAPAPEPAGVVEAEEAEVDIPEPTDPEEMAKFSYALEYIEGIGPVYAKALKEIGIGTPLALLRQGASRKGRAAIAEKSGVSSKLILEWVNHVDLFRIKGVGSEYADLLEAAGVDTVVELAQRNPANLHKKMAEVNEEKKLVRQMPTQSQVEDWVAQAKQLPRAVTY
jgi:uncharacterized membrane protein HdeD (DUF308 family)/predicted flap endonuclease-1-like 5' DNA nuclease